MNFRVDKVLLRDCGETMCGVRHADTAVLRKYSNSISDCLASPIESSTTQSSFASMITEDVRSTSLLEWAR